METRKWRMLWMWEVWRMNKVTKIIFRGRIVEILEEREYFKMVTVCTKVGKQPYFFELAIPYYIKKDVGSRIWVTKTLDKNNDIFHPFYEFNH